MTRAYATLAARGMRHVPLPVGKVTGPDPKDVRFERPKEGHQAIDRNDADLVTYALQRVVAYGTGTAAALPDGRDVAGKTGTTDNEANAWFCGYVPQLAACVWVGYPSGNKPMHNIEGVEDVFGGTIPAAIWHDFMEQATQGMTPRDFVAPDFNANAKEGPIPSPAPPPPPDHGADDPADHRADDPADHRADDAAHDGSRADHRAAADDGAGADHGAGSRQRNRCRQRNRRQRRTRSRPRAPRPPAAGSSAGRYRPRWTRASRAGARDRADPWWDRREPRGRPGSDS